ncbi:MAG TPA: chloride channel protein [Gammaproteobacteria bacterium]|jgi:CIC family chloride channel protein|nr:chloride channel protein [Gammaproteobacteria bacterium]
MDIHIDEPQPLKNIYMVFIGCCVGLLSGFGAVLFRNLINFIHNLFFSGHMNFFYNANEHTPAIVFGFAIIFIPMIGALLVTFLVENFAPEAKGHGVPEAMYAIYYKKGKIRPIVAVVKAITSAISIGTGGSVGREGPIIQIGAALGSTLGQLVAMPSRQRVLLIAAGAGAGIAATFNAPIGGLAFAIELMMVSVNAISIGIVTIAVVTATFIGYLFFGTAPALISLDSSYLKNYHDYFAILLLLVPFGVCIGIISAVFIKGIYWCEDLFIHTFKNPYLRHVTGMGLVGLMLYFFMFYFGHYYVEGVGYATIEDALHFIIKNPWLLLLLFVGKLLATCLTLGSGASGGVFSPSIFMGATFGGAYGIFLNYCFPQLGINPAVFVIAGMAGVMGSGTGAIMTAIVMTFEMTRDYATILPIMITVSIAYAIRLRLSSESIYTLKLFRRGFVLPKGLETGFVTAKNAVDIMAKNIKIIPKEQVQEWYVKCQTENNIQYVIVREGDTIQGILNSDIDAFIANTSPEFLIRKNFYWIDAKTTWVNLLRNIDLMKDHIILVTHSMASKHAEDILGVITYREIIQATKEHAFLAHT